MCLTLSEAPDACACNACTQGDASACKRKDTRASLLEGLHTRLDTVNAGC